MTVGSLFSGIGGFDLVPQCAEWIGRRILAVYGESPC